VKYAFIREREQEFRVVAMCRVLGVSKSGYYGWRKRAPSEQAQRRAVLDDLIRDAFFLEKCRAGSPRVYRRMKAAGIRVSEDFVAKRMKIMGLRAKAKRKFKATTNSNHPLPVAPNLLNRNFTARAEPEMGRRHHLSGNAGRLAVPRRVHRPVLTQSCRLEHGRTHDIEPGLRRA
jgi:transposase InsO family protein